MVNPTAPIASNEDSPAPNEPGIGGYSHSEHYTQHHATSSDSSPPPPTTELNPTLLHKRLLQVISPATTTSSGIQRPSSCPPEVTRVSNSSLGSASQAATEPDATINPKFIRTGTDITTLTIGNGEGGANSGVPQGGANTPAAQSSRPPLLSKKLLEPKVPIGENPTFKQCYMNTIKYSWLNVLLIFVPVSFRLSLLPTCQLIQTSFDRSHGQWTSPVNPPPSFSSVPSSPSYL